MDVICNCYRRPPQHRPVQKRLWGRGGEIVKRVHCSCHIILLPEWLLRPVSPSTWCISAFPPVARCVSPSTSVPSALLGVSAPSLRPTKSKFVLQPKSRGSNVLTPSELRPTYLSTSASSNVLLVVCLFLFLRTVLSAVRVKNEKVHDVVGDVRKQSNKHTATNS